MGWRGWQLCDYPQCATIFTGSDCHCSPVPGTAHPSLATPTSLGMRRTGDGHPMTVPHHPLGMTEKTTEDLRTALKRAGTRSRRCPAPTALPGLNFPTRRSAHPVPPPTCQGSEVASRMAARPGAIMAWVGNPDVFAVATDRNQPSSKSSPSLSGTSCPGVKEEPQHPDRSQPLISRKDGAQSREQTAQGPPAASGKVPEPPGPASTPQNSPATDPGAATEAAEPEKATEAAPVELGAKEKPAVSDSQGPSALETEQTSPEESSAGTGEHLEVEPCSQSVPKAGAGGGSHPHAPTASPEPAERVCGVPDSAGELLSGLQPSENSQVPSGTTVEPDTQSSQTGSDICAAPETSPGTQHPPGSGEMEPAAGGQHHVCSTLLTSSLAGQDLRSAAVLARKEEIELSYQQFSLTIAVVATMLLQKEPSMEAALGLALRANLRQGRIHHLQELEDFINSYDSATLSR